MVQAFVSPISSEEWAGAVVAMPTGKSPSPDSLPVSYYKSLPTTLTPHILKAYNLVGEEAPLPQTHYEPTSLIPKEGKDPIECQNYSPISLLNVDLKLFKMIQSSTLAPELSSIILYDQVGFIQTREARDSVTRVLDLIHASKERSLPIMLLSMDAKKAFGRVRWSFMEATLKAIGLGTRMMS